VQRVPIAAERIRPQAASSSHPASAVQTLHLSPPCHSLQSPPHREPIDTHTHTNTDRSKLNTTAHAAHVPSLKTSLEEALKGGGVGVARDSELHARVVSKLGLRLVRQGKVKASLGRQVPATNERTNERMNERANE
jgi:hypothetical protein